MSKTLQRIKEDLRWSRNGPRTAVAQERKFDQHKIWIEEDFLHFLEGYFNPFTGEGPPSGDANSVSWGFGTVLDGFDGQQMHSTDLNDTEIIKFLQVTGG